MTCTNREHVMAYIREHKQEFADSYGVISIGLFGSAIRDELHDKSDIDIAIEMVPEKKNLKNFLGFKRLLEQHFSCPVDLGIESSLKPAVRDRIKREIVYA